MTETEETVADLVENFSTGPISREKYSAVMTFFDQIADFDAMRVVTKIFYSRAESASGRYTALRGLGDMLAASGIPEKRREAMDMYRYLLESSMYTGAEFNNELPDLQHNYATLLYGEDYDDEAGKLWFQAYSQKPHDNAIRRAYGLYLIRAGRADVAMMVSEGRTPIDGPVLQPRQKELPEQFAPEVTDRWWED